MSPFESSSSRIWISLPARSDWRRRRTSYVKRSRGERKRKEEVLFFLAFRYHGGTQRASESPSEIKRRMAARNTGWKRVRQASSSRWNVARNLATLGIKGARDFFPRRRSMWKRSTIWVWRRWLALDFTQVLVLRGRLTLKMRFWVTWNRASGMNVFSTTLIVWYHAWKNFKTDEKIQVRDKYFFLSCNCWCIIFPWSQVMILHA